MFFINFPLIITQPRNFTWPTITNIFHIIQKQTRLVMVQFQIIIYYKTRSFTPRVTKTTENIQREQNLNQKELTD